MAIELTQCQLIPTLYKHWKGVSKYKSGEGYTTEEFSLGGTEVEMGRFLTAYFLSSHAWSHSVGSGEYWYELIGRLPVSCL